MRVVSWIVVLVSVGWLMVFTLGPGEGAMSGLPEVEMGQVTGTVTPVPPGPANASHQDLARRYTKAWNSEDPSRVASFFAPQGSITINGGEPYVGTAGLTEMAQGFMDTFPDLEVRMDGLESRNGRLVYRWTLTGTHAETGQHVKISGSETWRVGSDGLITQSIGRYDAEDYARQVAQGHSS